MTAKIIDGKKIAQDIREKLKQETSIFKQKHGRVPGLAVIRVGQDPASVIYVNHKVKDCLETGMLSILKELPFDISESELLRNIEELNKNSEIDGILTQLPLPEHVSEEKVISAILPGKDVDGFHPVNVGSLWSGKEGLFPCTAVGCIELLKSTDLELKGAHAVVIGRSNIVGKPVAQLLLRQNCTVTICHSRTRDLGGLVRQADLVVAAVGQPGLIKGDMIKKGAVVIDVGMNRLADGKLVGDVEYQEALKNAAWITPVPGGVGPLTRAILLKNTIRAALLAVADK
jgi:methylenetetrahydrofolate dehydrogenase (NADP+) / methenyltetrahydrofolate cyclohydrolase